MKIISWKRFMTFIFVVILFVVLILAHCSRQELQVKDIQEYEVTSGETLWSIASMFRPDAMSIQEYIYNLQEYNNIGSIIYPHQVLQILIYEEV